MTRRALFAALAAIPAAFAFKVPDRVVRGITVDGVWFPSMDSYLVSHGGRMENVHCVVHEPQAITMPFKAICNSRFDVDYQIAAPLLAWNGLLA